MRKGFQGERAGGREGLSERFRDSTRVSFLLSFLFLFCFVFGNWQFCSSRRPRMLGMVIGPKL